MTVAELVADLLVLDQNSEIFFTRNDDLPYVYAVSKLPDGTRTLAEMPSALLKPKENT
jgi:hypothetical protein